VAKEGMSVCGMAGHLAAAAPAAERLPDGLCRLWVGGRVASGPWHAAIRVTVNTWIRWTTSAS
jgi:dissimilatory sulfite reductase (desulfoviridin) alpha/beta subunit